MTQILLIESSGLSFSVGDIPPAISEVITVTVKEHNNGGANPRVP
jgi:hypothetical protein